MFQIISLKKIHLISCCWHRQKKIIEGRLNTTIRHHLLYFEEENLLDPSPKVCFLVLLNEKRDSSLHGQ